MQKSLPDTVAAVDIGSNSFHMIVARLRDDEINVIDRLRETVRLAAGLDENNFLIDESIKKALDCLARFGERFSHMPAESIRIVGTNTLRKARNANLILDQADELLGHPVEIISGVEEARLIYQGVAHSLVHEPPRKRLVIDIGGGSTELIIGKNYTPKIMESLYMGCVSVSRDYFPNGIISSKAVKKANLFALQELESVIQKFQKKGWDEVIGASGTIRAVERVVNNAGWCEDGITRDALEQLIDRIVEAGRIDKIDTPGLSKERAPVFHGGVIVLKAVFESLNIEHMHVSEHALREGVLYDLVGRLKHDDVRHWSVKQLAEKMDVDIVQAEHVSQTALNFLHKVKKKWKLNDEYFEYLLHRAAILHETGLSIAHSQYHKHGAYIIENSDLLGFSRQEQFHLALLVRSHRRKFPYSLYKNTHKKEMRNLMRLAILLRLAVLLNRSRNPEQLPDIHLTCDKHSLSLEFPADWLNNNPLTRADCEQEVSYLETDDFSLSFS